MTELDRRRPGVSFVGFAVSCVLLFSVVFTRFAPVMFPVIAFGEVVMGALLQVARRSSPWRPFGFGLLFGGIAGMLLTTVVVIMFLNTFSNLPI
ncbi:hypothetical protein [Actinophytocola sp.]|uniref:hypothetical protein n=1 Tax=Actinophytocola sp. TaxID=1872138 RepID=UPI002ECFC73A